MSGSRLVITQGEYCASADPEATISTLLGSCVACCLWDPVARAGGMNHILLASRSAGGQNTAANLAGINAMELLINDILKLGGMRKRLQAKAFGGAHMVSGLSDIGPENCAFVIDFLEREGIECLSKSLGGDNARLVVFTPSTGAVRVKAQHRAVDVPPAQVAAPAAGNGLELF